MKNLMSIGLLSLLCLTVLAQPSVEKGKSFYSEKKYDEAEKAFKTIPKNTREYPVANYFLGRIAFDKKEYDDAADYFEIATELNSKNAEYFNWLGDAYAAIGKNAGLFKQMSVGPKALRSWEKAAHLDEKNIDARVSLAGAYMQAPAFMGGGESKAQAIGSEALALLEEALKKAPEHHIYLYWYGKTSATTSLKMDRGEECLLKYLTFIPKEGEPSIAGAHLRLGQIKEKKGNKPDAKKNYELAVKLDGSLKQAKEGLSRVSK
ncbi:hypothetical protein WSM22_25340 [Cytophagales bacterium WSM2-2]|nr:hypothetical protein WSM22_25340 [Cytophagales bacterium WSM2-2]